MCQWCLTGPIWTPLAPPWPPDPAHPQGWWLWYPWSWCPPNLAGVHLSGIKENGEHVRSCHTCTDSNNRISELTYCSHALILFSLFSWRLVCEHQCLSHSTVWSQAPSTTASLSPAPVQPIICNENVQLPPLMLSAQWCFKINMLPFREPSNLYPSFHTPLMINNPLE